LSNGALAVVTATGARTVRGRLIKTMLYGSGTRSSFWAEFSVAVCILVGLAVANFILVNTVNEISTASVLRAIAVIVCLISPLLSVALLGGELRSAKRLRTAGIHSRDVHRLTMAGKANMVLLDKTGTITRTGLDFRGVVPASSLRLTECTSRDSPVGTEISACIALAHTVSICNGMKVGHEVELRMVEVASKLGWNFGSDIHAPVDPSGIRWEVERSFPFSHETMTMSAVVRQTSSGQRIVVCKGSFEALKQKCADVSKEMNQAVGIYAQEGCFIIGLSMRLLPEDAPPSTSMTRDMAETDLSFLGLILYRNEVKTDSEAAIKELKLAGMGVVMLTGDSVFTGTAVSRNVGIINQSERVVIGNLDDKTKLIEWRLADTDSLISEDSLNGESNVALCITGEVYEALRSEGKLNLDRIKVFGRVSPGQKAEIVRLYSDKGKTVVMCGDGANDSVALRSAHAGLAINSKAAEATVAAPFASDSESLSALVLLIREARCALCTSLAGYRFLVAVGMVHTLSEVVLYLQCGGYLSGVACLFIDCLILPIMLYGICSALPASKLANTPPEGSLLGPEMVLGAAWTMISIGVFLAIAEAVMTNADWFIPFSSSAPLSAWRERTESFESALIVVFRVWAYLDIALVYSYGSLHRQNILKNWRLVIMAMIFVGILMWTLFGPMGVIQAGLIVQVNKDVAIASGDTFLNNFLFYYEKIGGVWYSSVDSIEYPMGFRLSLVAVLISMSIVHHIGYRIGVLGSVSNFFHRLGWKDGGCWCLYDRRQSKAPRTSSKFGKQGDALDETITQAGEQESPALEWELRRTYGRWKAPNEVEYK
jgi:magnesium-transporting ATPase (P-type)